MTYAAGLSAEDGAILVSFPDFPNVQTFGNSKEEALSSAVDALETMFMGMIEDGETIPPARRLRRGSYRSHGPEPACLLGVIT